MQLSADQLGLCLLASVVAELSLFLGTVVVRLRQRALAVRSQFLVLFLSVALCTPLPSPLSLDVFRAAELSDRQAMDDRLELSTFGQIFQALRDKPPSFFRVSTYGRGWVVVSKGLHATDGGGPYRECLERMCQVGAKTVSETIRAHNSA